jgi:hypothetical protein
MPKHHPSFPKTALALAEMALEGIRSTAPNKKQVKSNMAEGIDEKWK